MNCYQDLKKSEISIVQENDDRITGSFRFDSTLSLFQGHFPGNPMLPGIFQVEMVRYSLEKIMKVPLRIQAVKKTKFSHLIQPNTDVTVEIVIIERGGELLGVKAVVRAQDVVSGKTTLTLTKRTAV